MRNNQNRNKKASMKTKNRENPLTNVTCFIETRLFRAFGIGNLLDGNGECSGVDGLPPLVAVTVRG